MGFYRGPNIITKNLKLYYDISNRKCFRGEPTINKANTDSLRTMVLHSGSVQFFDAPEKGDGWKKITINTISSNYRIAKFPYYTQSGETITYSIEYDFNGSVGYYWGLDGTIGTETGNYVVNDGSKFSLTYTNSVSQSLSLFLNNKTRINTSGFTDVIYYRYYQVESKPYPTSFTENYRGLTYSSGGGLYDLSKNNLNGDFINSIKYDYINLGNIKLGESLNSIQTTHNYIFTEYTVSMWFNCTNNSVVEGYGRTLFSTSTEPSVGNSCWILINGNNIRVYSFSWYDSVFSQTTSNPIELNKWYNLTVCGLKGGVLQIYVNSELIYQSSSNTLNTSSTTFEIGDLRPNRGINFIGYMNQVMFYDRLLDYQEIKQNYESSKYRYKS